MCLAGRNTCREKIEGKDNSLILAITLCENKHIDDYNTCSGAAVMNAIELDRQTDRQTDR